ncbi:MAG: universal stress protein [Aeromicrobium sp.]|jgi:nucleotide-binding universal stress UspA family protein|nr:MAG: universal stress protein [Aeromicrobium sp.]
MTESKIVVGIDDSPASIAAMKWAAAEAELRGLDLELVNVWQLDPSLAAAGVVLPWADFEEDALNQATDLVAEHVGLTDANGKERTITIVQGTPGPVMVDASKNATMLVVGTQVNTGLRRVIHGSVSHYCLTHAECVVVAVPVVAG